MRTLILAAVVIITGNAAGQNNTTANIIEGGKTLVELVRVFKTPKNSLISETLVEKKDSCAAKNTRDLCLKNSTGKRLLVSFYRRNGNLYEAGILSLTQILQ
jgi:hypothetical protein